MSTYRVRIEETYVYYAEYEAEHEWDAIEQAREDLGDADGPESAFGQHHHGGTEVVQAWDRAKLGALGPQPTDELP